MNYYIISNIEDINSLLNDRFNMRDNKNNCNYLMHKFDIFKKEIINKVNNLDNNCAKKNDNINL